ncbi:MAG: hypothetical protein ACTSRU_20060, partial [Candidatus Hodarchaeales archaeon]
MKELGFQKWFRKTFLPAAFDLSDSKIELIDVLPLSDKIVSGVPDMLIMTSEGVIAAELKYRTIPEGITNNSKAAFTHPISRLQEDILTKWGNIHSGLSFVVFGLNTIEKDQI